MKTPVTRHDPAEMAPAKSSCKIVGPRFCPFQSRPLASSIEFSEENRKLLLRRLRIGAVVMFLGMLAFRVHPLLYADSFMTTWPMLVSNLALAGAVGAVALAMQSGWKPGVMGLRAAEAVVFGLPAAFLIWLHVYRAEWGVIRTCEDAQRFIAETGVLWILLMQIYGVFVPNTLRRGLAVILTMAVVPVAEEWILSTHNAAVAEAVQKGALISMAMWLGFGAVASIYSSHRFVTLRREAYEARRLGSYTLSKRLGGGGMGDVFLAEHRLLKRPCAVKLIRTDVAEEPGVMARFEAEVQAAARLTHPNTIEIYDYGRAEDGAFYYAMEYLPGLSLQQIVDRHGPMPPERVVHLLRQICGALREAHAAGLVHRDLKPGNIYAARIGGMHDFGKLLDFGLVKSLRPQSESDSAHETTIGTFVGSPLFMAPESAMEGTIDPRGDIYSLGATAYFCLTGRPVFPGTNPMKILFAHANEPPLPPSTLAPAVKRDLEAVVMKCLAKKPSDRFETADDLEAALHACACADLWTQSKAAEWWQQIADEIHVEDESAVFDPAATVSLSIDV